MRIDKVTVEIMNEAREADKDFWLDYIFGVPADEHTFLPYEHYLALRLKRITDEKDKDICINDKTST